MEDYDRLCGPVEWREVQMRAEDGVTVRGVVGGIGRGGEAEARDGRAKGRRVVICYFHGNGGSLPPRLPMLSNVLKAIYAQQRANAGVGVDYVLVALSYRGYWTSSGRPSQAGIERDASALLRWVNETYGVDWPSDPKIDTETSTNTKLILWGQSLGAGVATTAAAAYARSEGTHAGNHGAHTAKQKARLQLAGLVLETPFTSIGSMLLALYPQTWLPYRYLRPFLRSHWDSEGALRALTAGNDGSRSGSGQKPQVFILSAAKDEVVPAGEAKELEAVCEAVGLGVERREVKGALHNEATTRREGREAVAGWVVGMVNRERGEPDSELRVPLGEPSGNMVIEHQQDTKPRKIASSPPRPRRARPSASSSPGNRSQ